MAEFHLSGRARYSRMSDRILDAHVRELTENHPNSGYRMIQAYLRARGLIVQEGRVRESVERVDPVGVAIRWSRNRTIHRRVYRVPYPNALWHIDGNMALIRWGFVVHGGVDGYSRLVTYLHCSTNNTANTVLSYFIAAGEMYGFPSRVRSDCGGENYRIAEIMILLRGTNRGSHITGRSTRNQRIERLWRDVFDNCLSLYYNMFYFLEDNGILDVENEVAIAVLQYIYQPRINADIANFTDAWNNHGLTSANSLTPLQLWTTGMLLNIGSHHQPVQEVFHGVASDTDTTVVTSESSDSNSQHSDEESSFSFNPDQLSELRAHIDPMQPSTIWGIDLYASALEIALQNI